MIYDLQRISRDSYNAFADILASGIQQHDQFKPQIANIFQILENSKHLLKNFMEVYQLPMSEHIDTFEEIINTSTELDTEIDNIFSSNTEIIIANTTDGILQPVSGYHFISSLRSLERVGDHCCNLIERAIYIQSGEKAIIK